MTFTLSISNDRIGRSPLIQAAAHGSAIMNSDIIQRGKAFLDRRAEEWGGVMAFSVRDGGCSPKPMESLNFSVHGGDSESNVQNNLKIFTHFLGINASRIVQIDQKHEDGIAVVNKMPTTDPVADAVIVGKPGIFAGIRTADCVPVLLMDPVQRICAAIHAGWRGTVLRITLQVVQKLEKEFGVKPANLIASIGPSIGPCCYEVDDRVLIPVMSRIPHGAKFVTKCEREREKGAGICQTVDLVSINKSELMTGGLRGSHIRAVGSCTSCNEKLFFSHRRDRAGTGRHIAIVGFRS